MQRLRQFFTRGGPKARRSVEITLQDQWVMKVLLPAGDRFTLQETVVEEAAAARRTLFPHDLVASLFKLQMYGFVETDGEGGYRVTARGRKLKGIIPERPGVNIEYYG